MELIRDGQIVQDAWRHVADGEAVPADGDIIVSLQRFRDEAEQLKGRAGKLGVRIGPDVHADEVPGEARALPLLAIDFPKYTDGRGYTTARLLRERYGYKGELRAVGDVLHDQLFFMQRCGMNAYELKPGKDIQEALKAFQAFTVRYQAAADESLPLYRRR